MAWRAGAYERGEDAEGYSCKKYEIRFSFSFRDSLLRLYDYIVQQYNDPINARKLVEKIERRCLMD